MADRLERRKTQRRWQEPSLARVEMDVMLAAYSMRKLMETTTKVPLSVRDQNVSVIRYPRTDAEGDPDVLNWHHVDRWYDLAAGAADSPPVRDLCNQVIHSWIFLTEHDDDGKGGLTGFLVSSDRARKKALYRLAIDDLVTVLRSFGMTEVAALRMERKKSGQWVVVEALPAEELPPAPTDDIPRGGMVVTISSLAE